MRVRERLCVELGGMRRDWDRWCVRRGMTVGEGTRQLVAAALQADAGNGNPGIDANVRWSVVDDPRIRIELRLTAAELEAVESRAEASGLTANRWIVALIRAQLTHEAVHRSMSQTGAPLYVAKSRKIRAIARSGTP